MKKNLIILALLLILTTQVVIAGSTDVLINTVKQEVTKIDNSLNIKLDTKFRELKGALFDELTHTEERLNERIDDRLNFMLMKFAITLGCVFLLALLISRFILLKQEKNNPFYLEYKKKQQIVNQQPKKQDMYNEEKNALNKIKEGITPPQPKTFTKEEVIILMQKQKQELSQHEQQETSELDELYKEVK